MAQTATADPNQAAAFGQLAAGLARWREDPVQFVRDVFQVEPDAWQREALMAFPTSPRLCMKACKGPGKTALLAWVGWNFLLTRPHPMIGATSISGDNLKANLWTELARWRSRAPILEALFEQTNKEIFLREHPKTWKIEARTWPKDADPQQIGNALAGLHAEYVMWLGDESGDYPDAIMPTMEGIFAGSPIEAHIVQAGNPTRLSGPLYMACTKGRGVWRLVEITADPDDPNRTPRVSVEHAREQIRLYGRDNPWVLVNIFGQFPAASFNALIGVDEVTAATKRFHRDWDYRTAAKIIGVDVARFGDDSSVLFPRQGVQAFPPTRLRNVDSLQGAGAVQQLWTAWEADACFVDNSGGFGSGWIDQLRALGRNPIPVDYSLRLQGRYFNKRAEMYFAGVQWIKEGGALPDTPEMAEFIAAMSQTTYTFKGEQMILEPKESVKTKLGFSPDFADAFIETFHSPVTAAHRAAPRAGGQNPRHQMEYNPFSSIQQN